MSLDRDDVVSCGHLSVFTGKPLFEYWEAGHSFQMWLSSKNISSDLVSGVPCKFLKTSGGGWKTGKFRIRLEFIPDPEPEAIKPKSPLDEFR